MDALVGTPSLPTDTIASFRKTVFDHYRTHGRDLPWRRTRNPYAILVSEVMLQQTQVARVITKYDKFLAAFPTVVALSRATAAEVLSIWQGLGYNRRALALHQAGRLMASRHHGAVPRSVPELRSLPGVGPATAAAVCVFAYGLPLAFMETNIRSAFIHFFFQECDSVPDAAIRPLVDLTLDRENPRDWYYALMDYGAWVKRTHPNPGRRSRHHVMQTPFAGSHRQLRAEVLRLLLSRAPVPMTSADIRTLLPATGAPATEIGAVLSELTKEGFLVQEGDGYRIA